MAKKIKKIMAMVLALCICFSALPLQALAAEGDIIEEKDGVTYTEGKTTPNADGTVTVTVKYNTTDENANVQVNGSESTTKDADGNVTKVEGEETKTYTEAAKPGEDFSVNGPVNVTITDNGDGSFTFEGSATGETKVTEKKDDKNYTEKTDERVVNGTVEITGEDFEIKTDGTTLECPVAPEQYEGKEEFYDGSHDKIPDLTGKDHNNNDVCAHDRGGLMNNGGEEALSQMNPSYVKPKPDSTQEGNEEYKKGFDLVWNGYGDSTEGAVAVFAKYEFEKNEDGTDKLDENGNPIVKKDENGNPIIEYYTKGAKDPAVHGMVSQSNQFALQHENGNYFYAYCMDASTGASPELNRWYQIRNLEDAVYDKEQNPDGYLTAEDAAKIRAIVGVGYWGTDANVYEKDTDGNIKYQAKVDENGNTVYETDAEGNVKVDESGNPVPVLVPVTQKNEDGSIKTDSSVRGSVASLKEMVRSHYSQEGMSTKITVTYPDGTKSEEIDILEVIDGLTESEALAVTQAAIWTFANNEDINNAKNNDTQLSVVGVLSALKLHNGTHSNPRFQLEYVPEKNAESDARLQALYQYLIGLEPIEADDGDDTNVIPSENVITGAALVIQDKDAEHANNKDEDTDNDVYNTDLNFTLAFVPDPKTDDMMVYLYVDGQEEPMQYRLAGGENDVIYNPDGSFTLKNIQLQEGIDHGFDLQIHGTQNLSEGVYIYQAKGGRGASQTLVGLAQGKQNYVSSTTMTINFTVDEQRNVVAQRTWIDNKTVDTETPIDPGEDPVDPQDPPQVFNLNRDGVVEIIDEQVPLAAAPKTGDVSFLFIALALFAAISLCAANFDKKRKQETF